MVGKRILILDENPASRKFLVKALLDRQFEVLEAPSAKEALIAAWRDEFISKIRNNPRIKTTRLGPARREACITAGVNEYIVKSSQALSALEETLSCIFSTAQA